MLKQIDGAEVHVLVEDVADPLSSVPAFVETEFAALERRRGGAWVLSGNCFCSAAHGLSFLITLRQGSTAKTLLFDAGARRPHARTECFAAWDRSRCG